MRPRGLSSLWIIVTNTYGTEKKQPSRQREMVAVLTYEIVAEGEDA